MPQNAKKVESSQTVGAFLKELRIKKGFTVDDVAQSTKIRKYFIQAIEDDNLTLLPGGVYSIGFIRNYALFLDTEPSNLIQRLENQQLFFNDSNIDNQQNIAPFGKKPLYTRWHVIIGLVALLGIILYHYIKHTKNTSHTIQAEKML